MTASEAPSARFPAASDSNGNDCAYTKGIDAGVDVEAVDWSRRSSPGICFWPWVCPIKHSLSTDGSMVSQYTRTPGGSVM